MSNTLTLNAAGTDGCSPYQNPWTPTHGAAVSIVNSSGHDQTLSNISNGCLIQTGGGAVTQIDISSGGTWNGRAGGSNNGGSYDYEDGSNKRGMRNGTIDPS
ncbi:MAG: hypothetical protein PVJ33_09555 [Lysobacterales bacterium]|jgi:hypothetical protein